MLTVVNTNRACSNTKQLLIYIVAKNRTKVTELPHYGNTGCWVYKQGVQNWKDFCPKINIPKGNYWILRIGVMGRCQILGIILENKVI